MPVPTAPGYSALVLFYRHHQRKQGNNPRQQQAGQQTDDYINILFSGQSEFQKQPRQDSSRRAADAEALGQIPVIKHNAEP
ncbi:hypothetical protein D3C73_1451530 [compost metagenome]